MLLEDCFDLTTKYLNTIVDIPTGHRRVNSHLLELGVSEDIISIFCEKGILTYSGATFRAHA